MKSLLLFLGVCFSALILLSCDNVKGEGPIVTETIQVEDFQSFDLQGSFDVIVLPGITQSVSAEGHANIIDRLVRDVDGGNWEVKLKNGNYHNFELTITITTPGLEEIRLSGSGDIEISQLTVPHFVLESDGSGDIRVTGALEVQDHCELLIRGSGDMNVDFIQASSAQFEITGSGDMRLDGEVNNAEYRVSGSGDLHAFDLKAEDAEVHSSGSGVCELTAHSTLDVEISGSGNVCYRGNPVISQQVSGSGNLVDKN